MEIARREILDGDVAGEHAHEELTAAMHWREARIYLTKLLVRLSSRTYQALHR